MKNIILLLLLGIPFFALAQAESIEKFYDNYKNHDQVNTVTLSKGFLKLTASATEENDKNLLEKISRLRLLIMSEGNLVSKQDYTSFRKALKKDAFAELMNIREEGTNVDIFFREEGEYITDVLLLVNEANNFVLLSLEGLFKFSDLNDLNLDFEGGEHLNKIPEQKKQLDRA